MTKEALKLALEALEEAWYHVGTFQPTEKAIDLYDEAITAIKEALAQPEQEPVAVWELQEDGWDTICDGDWLQTLPVGTKLYTAPPKLEQEPEPDALTVVYMSGVFEGRKLEREACAKLADSLGWVSVDDIRARGNT